MRVQGLRVDDVDRVLIREVIIVLGLIKGLVSLEVLPEPLLLFRNYLVALLLF